MSARAPTSTKDSVVPFEPSGRTRILSQSSEPAGAIQRLSNTSTSANRS